MNRALDFVVYGAAVSAMLVAFGVVSRIEQQTEKQAEAVAVAVESEPAPQSAIHYTSQAGCRPCQAFSRIVPELESVGWLMVKCPPDRRGTPAFDLFVGGKQIATRTGYSSKSNFYRWLRQSVEANQ